jgi:hypothetical protein
MIERACKNIEFTDSKSKILYVDPLKGDTVKRKSIINIAKKKLDEWEPKNHLELGLVKKMTYFSDLMKE